MRTTVFLSLLVLIDCRADDAEPPEAPAIVIQIQPGDLTSQAGESPIKIRFVSPVGEIPASLVELIAARTALKQWMRQETVPIRLSIQVVNKAGHRSGGVGVPATTEITIEPTSPLQPDEWYAVKIADFGKNSLRANERTHLVLPSGELLSRFVLGTRPVLAGVRICPKNGYDITYVDFSERIATGALQTGKVELRAGGAACEAFSPGPVEDSAKTISFKCPKASAVTEIIVSLDGAVAANQRSVGTLDSAQMSFAGEIAFKPDSFVGGSDACMGSRWK